MRTISRDGQTKVSERTRTIVARLATSFALTLPAVVGAFPLAPHAAALPARPEVVSIAVKPTVFPASGGTFSVSARVRNARECAIDAKPLVRRRIVNCSSGRVTFSAHAPANTGTGPAIWGVSIEAYGGDHTAYSREVEVKVMPNAPPAPPVHDLDECTPGPECDYGAADESFETWGNVAPSLLGDCTFAAAADWEQIVLGVHADPTVIGYEFAEAGGTAQGGLAQGGLWTYWRRSGIAGVYLTGLHSYYTDEADVRNAVGDYGALIAELSFTPNDGFGTYSVTGGLHDVVVDGFTPEGPLVTTWGETIQMTWEQWGDEVVGMWGIGVSQ